MPEGCVRGRRRNGSWPADRSPVTVVRHMSKNPVATVAAFPFYAVANSEETSKEVWIGERAVKPGDASRKGRPYRPVHKVAVQSVAPSPTENDGR